MQAAFDEKFAQYLGNKKGTIHIPNAAKYDSILAAIRKSQSGQPLISGDERNYATRFSIGEVNGEEIVVKGNKIVVTQEQITRSPTPSRSPSHSRSQNQFRQAAHRIESGMSEAWIRCRQKTINFEDESDENEDDYDEDIEEQNELNDRFFRQQNERAGASKQQKRQADQMYAPIGVGDSVTIPIPEVDRAKTDSRNLMGVVMETDNGFYRVGTKAGILNEMYSRNQLDPCSSQFLTVDRVPQNQVSLRTAVGADSLSGSQGHVHCACISRCKTKKCKCKSLGRLCNSRCHNSSTCENK